MDSLNSDSEGRVWGCAAVEAGVHINEDGTFGLWFDRLEPCVLMVMLHPGLVNVVMPQVWEAADEKGIDLR